MIHMWIMQICIFIFQFVKNEAEKSMTIKEQVVKTAISEMMSCIRSCHNICIYIFSESACVTRIADTHGHAHPFTLLTNEKNNWSKFSHTRITWRKI
jgi:hypothetical protein